MKVYTVYFGEEGVKYGPGGIAVVFAENEQRAIELMHKEVPEAINIEIDELDITKEQVVVLHHPRDY